MKKYILVCVAFCCSLNVFAQEKQMLTKGETISYINKVLKRTLSYKCPNSGCSSVGQLATLEDISFAEDKEDGILYTYRISDNMMAPGDCGTKGCCWEGYTHYLRFNPVHISSMALATNPYDNKAPVYSFVISFTKKDLVRRRTTTYKGKTSERTVDEIKLYFLMSDPSDFEKLKKAVTHLKALYKAEDDPFGE